MYVVTNKQKVLFGKIREYTRSSLEFFINLPSTVMCVFSMLLMVREHTLRWMRMKRRLLQDISQDSTTAQSRYVYGGT